MAESLPFVSLSCVIVYDCQLLLDLAHGQWLVFRTQHDINFQIEFGHKGHHKVVGKVIPIDITIPVSEHVQLSMMAYAKAMITAQPVLTCLNITRGVRNGVLKKVRLALSMH